VDSEVDALASLEDRILRAAELVSSLRAERDAAVAALAETHKLREELDSLRAERKHVRVRIEKLLGQMDLLSGS
jgi:hypothetical protein